MSTTTKVVRRFLLSDVEVTGEGWRHVPMPWGAQILNVALINRAHVALWALVTLEPDQPPQDRYFFYSQDDQKIVCVSSAEFKPVGSCETSGIGVHVFEVTRR